MARSLSSGHCAFTQQVNWIDHLGIAQPISRNPPALDTHMNTARARGFDQASSPLCERRAKVPVFLPTVEYKALVEPHFADRRGTKSHVAAIWAEGFDPYRV